MQELSDRRAQAQLGFGQCTSSDARPLEELLNFIEEGKGKGYGDHPLFNHCALLSGDRLLASEVIECKAL